jgi:hypothetical protein
MAAPSANAQVISNISLLVGAVVVVVYGYVTYEMAAKFVFVDKSPEDTLWQHAVVLYNAIASIAFSAFGVLLGASVQQVHLNEAKQTIKAVKDDVKAKIDALDANDEAGGPPQVQERRATERRRLEDILSKLNG